LIPHARCGARRFISSSGGNADIAVTCSGRSLGLPVEVVLPQARRVLVVVFGGVTAWCDTGLIKKNASSAFSDSEVCY
jgi:hypothetical protein